MTLPQTSLAALAAALLSTAALAQTAIPRVEQLAELKPALNLEGLAYASDGAIIFSNDGENVLMRYADGKLTEFAQVPSHPQGIVATRDGFVVTSHAKMPVRGPGAPAPVPGAPSPMAALDGQILVLDKAGKLLKSIPTGDGFPNGIAHLSGNAVLVANAAGDRLWKIDTKTGAVETWLQDEMLAPTAARPFPGANGLKIVGGWVYGANTTKGFVYKVKIGKNGKPDGGPQKIADVAGPDEVAVAKDGTVYVATHGPWTKVTPGGEVSKLFPTVEGGPSLMLSKDEKSLYLLTSGANKNGVRTPTRFVRAWLP